MRAAYYRAVYAALDALYAAHEACNAVVGVAEGGEVDGRIYDAAHDGFHECLGVTTDLLDAIQRETGHTWLEERALQQQQEGERR